jgi:3-oxoacyl-[acyl-carrier protein] reductase
MKKLVQGQKSGRKTAKCSRRKTAMPGPCKREKVAFVTGAGADGIAQGVIRRLVLEGGFRKIALQYCRSLTPGFVRWLKRRGVTVLVLKADFSDPSGMAPMVKLVRRKLGRIDLLVNVAGVTYTNYLTEIGVEDVIEAMKVNFVSPFLLTIAVAPHMVKKDPQVIFISSNHVIMSTPFHTLYAASKGAMEACLGNIGLGLRERGFAVRVNMIRPGWVVTERHRKADAAGEYSLAEAAASNPTGRIAVPEEIGDVVLNLLKVESIDMSILDVDNGARHAFAGEVEDCQD